MSDPKKPTVGMTVTRFYFGERFVFTYVGGGDWSCDKNPYPTSIFDFV